MLKRLDIPANTDDVLRIKSVFVRHDRRVTDLDTNELNQIGLFSYIKKHPCHKILQVAQNNELFSR